MRQKGIPDGAKNLSKAEMGKAWSMYSEQSKIRFQRHRVGEEEGWGAKMEMFVNAEWWSNANKAPDLRALEEFL